MPSQHDISVRRRAFRQLHESGCFVIPNPWDQGSAKYLEKLGFKALATTSSGAAWRHAKADGGMTLEEVLVHLREMAGATSLPVNADFEAGYAADAAGVARNVRLAVETGVAGLSIEDSTGDADAPLRDLPDSVDRIRAARAAIDEAGGDTLLIGRAENFIVGRPDLDDAIGCKPMPKPAPIACTRRASRRPRRLPRWWRPWHLSRSTCWSAPPLNSRCATSKRWACGASAWAARWRGPPGAASCVRHR